MSVQDKVALTGHSPQCPVKPAHCADVPCLQPDRVAAVKLALAFSC